MRFLNLRRVVSRRPLAVVVAWVVLAAVVGLAAPNLTRLAAEGQANLLPSRDESVRVGQIVARAWPDQAYQSVAVVALHREPKLTTADKDFARRLAAIFDLPGRPRELIRVLGPQSPPDVAARLVSHDGSMQLVLFALSSSFVSPATERAVAWLQKEATALDRERPDGLEVLWSGDAVLGRDYMNDVQQSLNRSAVATVALLLVVLLIVYRSLLVALVPLVTIGISLVVSRGRACMADLGGLGSLSAGRALPGGGALRQRHRLLPVPGLAIRRALLRRRPRPRWRRP